MALPQQVNREISTVIPRRKRDRLRLLRKHPGILSRVARRSRVNRSLVTRVFHGQTASRRIQAALLNEFRRCMERAA